MPKFKVDLECDSCLQEQNGVVLEVENTSGPDDNDVNKITPPFECPNCGDQDWHVLGYENA